MICKPKLVFFSRIDNLVPKPNRKTVNQAKLAQQVKILEQAFSQKPARI